MKSLKLLLVSLTIITIPISAMQKTAICETDYTKKTDFLSIEEWDAALAILEQITSDQAKRKSGVPTDQCAKSIKEFFTKTYTVFSTYPQLSVDETTANAIHDLTNKYCLDNEQAMRKKILKHVSAYTSADRNPPRKKSLWCLFQQQVKQHTSHRNYLILSALEHDQAGDDQKTT